MYRAPNVAPRGLVAEERRGPVRGHFCRACGSVYSLYSSRHKGKPMYGKDHVAAPCTHEGQRFEEEAVWWEPAVEVLPVPAAPESREEGAPAAS